MVCYDFLKGTNEITNPPATTRGNHGTQYVIPSCAFFITVAFTLTCLCFTHTFSFNLAVFLPFVVSLSLALLLTCSLYLCSNTTTTFTTTTLATITRTTTTTTTTTITTTTTTTTTLTTPPQPPPPHSPQPQPPQPLQPLQPQPPPLQPQPRVNHRNLNGKGKDIGRVGLGLEGLPSTALFQDFCDDLADRYVRVCATTTAQRFIVNVLSRSLSTSTPLPLHTSPSLSRDKALYYLC